MPRNITVTFEDGTRHVYQGAPDDIQPDAVAQRAQQEFGKAVKALDGGRGAPPAPGSDQAPSQEGISGLIDRLPTAGPAGLVTGALKIGRKVGRAFTDLSSGSVVDDARAALGAAMDETGLLGVGRGAKDILDTGAAAAAGLYDGIRRPGANSLVTGSTADQVRAANEAGRAEYENAVQNPMRNMLGRVAGQAVVTAPVGGVLAAPLRAAAPLLGGAAPAANKLAQALATGGFSTGAARATVPATMLGRIGAGSADLGIRALGGAVTGGVSGALVDPNSAGLSALLGGGLPIAVRAAGAGGAGVARLLEGREKAGARALADALELPPNELRQLVQQLRNAKTFVPGSRPTVSQATMNPGAAALEDIVSEASLNNALLAARRQQAAARGAALESVAPVQVGGPEQARQDLGEAIGRYAIPEQKAIKTHIMAMFENVDDLPVGPYGPQQPAALELPLKEMQAQIEKFAGRGAVNVGSDANAAMGVARDLTRGPAEQVLRRAKNERGIFRMQPETVPGRVGQEMVGWKDLQDLRGTIGDLAAKLRKDPSTAREAAALEQMQGQIDARVKSAVAGQLNPGEVFTPEMADRWTSALAAHKNMKQRFMEGPQRDIFRRAGNGEPMVQGGEIAAKFWGNRPGAADDVRAFRRLIDDNPALLGQFRSMITTEGAAAAGKGGDLGQKYVNWVRQSLPALREAMDPAELNVLQNIAEDISRAERAAASSAPRGSKTFRNANNALRLGLIDNPVVSWAANKVPFGGALQAGLQRPFREVRANALAELLADPAAAANALDSLTGPSRIALDPMLSQLPYRVAPLLPADR